MHAICVYCGSSAGRDPAYADAARDLAGVLAARGMGLVYGGANRVAASRPSGGAPDSPP